MSIDAPETDRATAAIHRRQLLKIGAWAAPVIVLATALPAAAASGDVVDLRFTTSSLFYTWGTTAPTGIGGTFTITPAQTAGSGSTATSMTLVVAVQSQGLTTAAPTITGAGWSVVSSAAGSGTNAGYRLYTLAYVGTVAAGASTTVGLPVATSAGFAATNGRQWTASLSGTSQAGTVVSGTNTSGTVAVAAPGTGAVSAPTAPTPTVTGNGKTIQLSVLATSSKPAVARLTVTRQHNNDAFATSAAWPSGTVGTEGSVNNTTLVATSIPFTGQKTVNFPPFVKQTGGADQNYTIHFLIDGVIFGPATKTGVI